MLDNLALPFLIAASSCTRSNIRKTLAKEAKFLEIHIAPPLGVLRFDLDFRNGVLRRIIDRHSSHNSARGVLTNTSNDRRAVLQQMEEEKEIHRRHEDQHAGTRQQGPNRHGKGQTRSPTTAEDLEKRFELVDTISKQLSDKDLNVQSS
ncbi:hypothetical protein LTR67_008070 [Exophiala xenobiotica]